MPKRRKSRRKPNFYVKPPRTPDMVAERTRQLRAGGQHDKPRKSDISEQEHIKREMSD